jgi:hypothetical protein
MTSDGVVSFGANTKELFTLFPFPAPPDFLTGFPRIAGLWADLAPNPGAQPEGAYSVAAGAGAVTFQWSSVPLLGHLGANTFSVTLAPGGGITTTHGPVVTIDAIVGVSAGGAKALGTELPVNLSALPLPIGTGRETAVWEYFTLVSPVDLTGLTLPWSGAGPALYQDAPASPGSVRVALGAGAAEAGRPYVAALSLTSTPGISLPGCPRPIPLGLDPVLLLSLTGGIGGGSGVLDGRGQKDGWPAAPPASPVTIPVPPGLAGRGVTLWFAFVTVAPGGGCPFPFVSPAIAFPIP